MQPTYPHQQQQFFAQPALDPSGAVAQPAILPNPSTYIQRYDELDAGLADVLASISESPDMQSNPLELAALSDEAVFAAPRPPIPGNLPDPYLSANRLGQNSTIGQPPSLRRPSAHEPSQQQYLQHPDHAGLPHPSAPAPAFPPARYYEEPAVLPSMSQASVPTYQSSAPTSYTPVAGSASYSIGQAWQPASTYLAQQTRHEGASGHLSSSTSPSHLSSPGHEYFERHPSISAGDASSQPQLLAVRQPVADTAEPMRGSTTIAPARENAQTPATAGNGYLDSAWMDYFPTPGVGLFQQAIPPATPVPGYASGPRAVLTQSQAQQSQNEAGQTYPSAAYYQQAQQQPQARHFPSSTSQRYYGIEQQGPAQQQPGQQGPIGPNTQQQQQYRSSYGR